MRYEKPMVMDLSARARAAGLGPWGCFNGDVPDAGSYYCQNGTTVIHVNDYTCTVGPEPGTSTVRGNCFSGAGVTGETTIMCMIGTVGYHYDDPCTSGPSPG